MPWFLYLIQCSDDSLYTGITTDLNRRLSQHNAKKGAAYTRNKTPVKLVYHQDFSSRSLALKQEARIKSLTREEKLTLAGLKIR